MNHRHRPIERRLLPLCAGRPQLAPRLTVALAAIGLMLALSTTAWACPGCKEALASGDGSGGDLVSGFFWSILFMLSMPFLIFGTFCTSMYVAVRRARAAQAKAGAVPTVPPGAPVSIAPHDSRGTNPGSQSLVGA